MNKILDASGKPHNFVYDAAETSHRRRQFNVSLKSEDRELTRRKRSILTSDTRNVYRNFAVARWAVEKHITHVANLSFQARTQDESLNQRIEDLIKWWGRPRNLETSGRFSLPKLLRIIEHASITDGDVFILRLSDGRLQIIEGDRVKNPPNLELTDTDWVHGVNVSPTGRIRQVCVTNRVDDQFNIIPGQFINHYAQVFRADQVRGISPLASSLNSFKDVAEASIYALARMKVEQLFALKITREGDEPLDGDSNPSDDDHLNFTEGPTLLDLEPGEDAGFLQSSNPSTQFAAFIEAMLMAALKSLDIPYSFYREDFTNYSGARSALLLYQRSVEQRQEDLKQLLNNLVRWRLRLFIEDGVLQLPSGMSLAEIEFEWLGRSIGLIDPMKEANSMIALVNNNLASRQDTCKAQGKDWHTLVKQLAHEKQVMAELGLASDVAFAPVEAEQEDSLQLAT